MPRNNPKARRGSKPDGTRAPSSIRGYVDGNTSEARAKLNPDRALTQRQKDLAKAMALPGMSNKAAARLAGFSEASGGGMVARLLADPAFQKRLEAERKEYVVATSMTKKRVIDGFLRAVELSELKTDSIAMTAAWREIGRLCGYYAPKIVQHKISIEGEALKEKLKGMSDIELMRLNQGDNDALEGDFEVVQDGNMNDGIRDDLTSVR